MISRAIVVSAVTASLVAASVVVVALPASATDYPVTDQASLEAALTSAGDGDTITFEPLTSIALVSSLPASTADLTILGNDATIIGGGFSVFSFTDAAVALSDLQIVDAFSSIEVVDSSIAISGVDVSGGGTSGLTVDNAVPGLTVQITESTFSADWGDGAVVALTAGGTVTMTDVAFTDNDGTGLCLTVADGVTATLTRVSFTGNGGAGLCVTALSGSSVSATGLLAAGNVGVGVGVDADDESVVAFTDSSIADNVAGGIGAGLADESQLFVENSSISGPGEGFGLIATIADSSIRVLRSSVTDHAFGGIDVTTSGASSLEIDTSTVSGAGVFGVYADVRDESAVVISRSTISDNGEAGAAFRLRGSGTATVDSSTVSNNGILGLRFSAQTGTSVEIVNSTVSGTVPGVAGQAYGVLYEGTAEFSLRNSTITANDVGAGGAAVALFVDPIAVISHSILAGNTVTDGSDLLIAMFDGSAHLEWSLIGTMVADITAPIMGAGVTIGITDPGLEPLAENGGPTLTHKPRASSPAINAGDTAIAGAPAEDQRGEARIAGGRIDIGSVEIAFELPATGSSSPVEGPIIALGMLLLGVAAVAVGATRRRQA